jgi:predicted cation transporter
VKIIVCFNTCMWSRNVYNLLRFACGAHMANMSVCVTQYFVSRRSVLVQLFEVFYLYSILIITGGSGEPIAVWTVSRLYSMSFKSVV